MTRYKSEMDADFLFKFWVSVRQNREILFSELVPASNF